VLQGLTALESVDIFDNDVTDITLLGNLPALQVVDVGYNPVTSLDALLSSPNITSGDTVRVP